MNKQQQAKARRQKSRRKRSVCKRRGTVCGQNRNSVRTEISGHACENKIAQARNFPPPVQRQMRGTDGRVPDMQARLVLDGL